MFNKCCLCCARDCTVALMKYFECNEHYCCDYCSQILFQCPKCESNRNSYIELISNGFLKSECVRLKIKTDAFKSIDDILKHIIKSESKTIK